MTPAETPPDADPPMSSDEGTDSGELADVHPSVLDEGELVEEGSDWDDSSESLVRETATPEQDALLQGPSTLCLNCGQVLPGAYCPSCGQKAQVRRQPVHHFMRDSFVEFFGVDGRVWTSMAVLLFNPGRLTRVYISGQRVRYLRPLRIYLSSTLLFFVLLATVDPAGRLETAIQTWSASSDSVSVAEHLVYHDSLRAALPERWAAEDQERDALRARADSLQAIIDRAGAELDADRLDELAADIGDLRDEASVDSEDQPTYREKRLRRMAIESAILAAYPPDSVIVVDELHGQLEAFIPLSRFDVTLGPSWMPKGRAARSIREARTPEERIQAGAEFLRVTIAKTPTVMFILLPLFAWLLKLLYVRRDWFYSEHLVFALHTHAFAFVVFSVMTLFIWLGADASWTSLVLALLYLAIPIYFLLAMKHVYEQGWIRTLAKAWLLAWMYGLVISFGLLGAILLAASFG